MILYRKKIGIIDPEEPIYLDHQRDNQRNYYDTLIHLSNYFGVSKTMIKHRIEDLDLIIYDEKMLPIQTILKKMGLKN